MLTKPPIPLQPGDFLGYNTPWSLVDFIIRLKTWSKLAHCEIYSGDGMSVASRNSIGVNEYPFRSEGLVCVLRPIPQPLDAAKARRWFMLSARGQKYDFTGLLCFVLAAKRGSPDRMFCSEFATRWYRQAGLDVFNPHWDADKVAPGNFLMTPALKQVWP